MNNPGLHLVQIESDILSPEEASCLAERFENRSPQELLGWVSKRFDYRQYALVASFQVESSVLIDMAWRLGSPFRVVTIDTGRLPQETYDLIDEVRERYQIPVEVILPDARQVEDLVQSHGMNLFRQSVSQRLLCCQVRKVVPLGRVLEGLDAWVTGLRRNQTSTRAGIRKIDIDHDHGGIVKVSPLANWDEEMVWDYIRRHDVPYHRLYDQGFTSIGCAPCTRAVRPGEDSRSGRWWWENGVLKECGMHCSLETGRFQAQLRAQARS